MKRPTIFVTNDDGIHSPGLRAAAEAALSLGKVVVCAPTRQGTSMGRCLRGGKNEKLHPLDYEVGGQAVPAYHCDGSPAMAVKHGMDVLFPHEKPDLVIAGINYGENLSVHITHSGTVGAALQGSAYHVPALAASVQTGFENHFNYGELDWTAAIHFTGQFARLLLQGNLPDDVDILNLNVPTNATAQTPWRITCLSRQAYYHSSIAGSTLDSRIGDAKLRIEIDRETLDPESDIQALALDKVVSVTPLSLDLTARTDRKALAQVFRHA